MYKKFFAIGLAISFAVTGGFLGWQEIELNRRDAEYQSTVSEDVITSEQIPAEEELPEEPVITAEETVEEDQTVEPEPAGEQNAAEEIASRSESPIPGQPDPSPAVQEEDIQTPQSPNVPKKFATVFAPEFVSVDTSYFEDALFVGDSRMVGIKEYGGLKEPTYFAGTGLSTFKLYKEELEVDGMGTVMFEDVLNSRQFGKVYIMLGINEAGSKLSEYKDKYDSILADIKEKQPDALIFLCSNLHVTKAKSESDKTYSNSHIDDINSAVEALAMKYGAYYLDVNPLFDDGEGNLSTDYAADYAHMYGRCYLTWIDWLCTKGIVPLEEFIEQAY